MTAFMHPRRIPALLAALTLLGGLARPARADDIRAELAETARVIQKRLADRPEKDRTVTVGAFTCPTNANASGGARLQQTLTEELKSLGVSLLARGSVGVTGEFQDVNDEKSGLLSVRIQVRLVDRAGKALGTTVDRTIISDQAVAALLGPPGPLPPNGTGDDRSQKFKDNLNNPRMVVKGSKVYSAEGGKYAVELLVDGKPVAGKIDEGLAFVGLQRDQTYAVRIHNEADHEIAVDLTIDGLSLFAFSEARTEKGDPKYRCVMVPAKSSALVKGWHITNKRIDQFQVMEYGKSGAGLKGASMARIGTVTASVAACWEKGSRRPADEMTPGIFGRSLDGTGRGVAAQASFGERARVIGKVRDNIPIRYSRATP